MHTLSHLVSLLGHCCQQPVEERDYDRFAGRAPSFWATQPPAVGGAGEALELRVGRNRPGSEAIIKELYNA